MGSIPAVKTAAKLRTCRARQPPYNSALKFVELGLDEFPGEKSP
jgi:hypothetical protein